MVIVLSSGLEELPQLTPAASAIRTVKASVTASLRPVNISHHPRNITILAERWGFARCPIEHGLGHAAALFRLRNGARGELARVLGRVGFGRCKRVHRSRSSASSWSE